MVHRSNANRLLSSIGERELKQLMREIEPISLAPDDVLFEPKQPMKYVYFPQAGVVSVSGKLEDGRGNEVGLVGREGFLCGSVVLGAETSIAVSKVEIAGAASRMPIEAFRDALAKGGQFKSVLFQYTLGFGHQLTQLILCSRHHKLTQRLARILLMIHDRVDGDHLNLTQDALASILGAHRPAVTTSILALQRAGLIRSQHGLTIADRAGLEAVACECYQAFEIRDLEQVS